MCKALLSALAKDLANTAGLAHIGISNGGPTAKASDTRLISDQLTMCILVLKQCACIRPILLGGPGFYTGNVKPQFVLQCVLEAERDCTQLIMHTLVQHMRI